MKTGDIVRIDTLGHDLHVIIGQAPKGYWVQNLRTGALPTQQHTVKVPALVSSHVLGPP